MSTGMADCSAYKELIQLVIDDESSSEEETYLRKHMEMCLKCLSQYEIDKELKEVLKLKLEKKQVPVGLSETIRSKLIK